jgi:hypothetical protein
MEIDHFAEFNEGAKERFTKAEKELLSNNRIVVATIQKYEVDILEQVAMVEHAKARIEQDRAIIQRAEVGCLSCSF